MSAKQYKNLIPATMWYPLWRHKTKQKHSRSTVEHLEVKI